MATTTTLIDEGHGLAETLLAKTALWRMKFARPLFIKSRIVLDALACRLSETQQEVSDLKAKLRAAETRVNAARNAAEKVGNRISVALGEMTKTKDNRRSEKPFAIVVSPYQMEQMRWLGGFRQTVKDDVRVTEYSGVRIFTAKGIYGPLVLTEDAFNAFSRQAPELMLKAA
jgi:hypothetical protein